MSKYRRKTKVRKDPHKIAKGTKVHEPEPKKKKERGEVIDWTDLNWEDPLEHEDFSQG